MGSPTQAEPLPSAVRPTRFTAPVGCACESRSPVELPRYSVATSCSAKPASTASRARARPNAPDSADSTPSSAPESVSSGSSPKSRAGRASPARRGRRHPRPAAPPGASARAAAAISATPSAPTSPVRRAEPKDVAGERDDADGAPALHAVGRRRVQGEADVGVAGLLDQHHAAVRPEAASARPRSWARHPRAPVRGITSASRLLARVEHPHTAHEDRRAAVRDRAPPDRAGPCRS